MTANKNEKHKSAGKYTFVVFCGTFFIAAFLSGTSGAMMSGGKTPVWSILLLLIVIAMGILFDIVGVAFTVADPATFNAKAARRILGATKALSLLKSSDRVSNICNDVVGDICGTVSGALGAGISISLFGGGNIWGGLVIAGLVSAFTVGGKSITKSYSIKNADEIVWVVSQILSWKEIWKFKRNVNKGDKNKNR